MGEYPVKIDIEYEKKASRLEVLIIRWLYGFVLLIVLGVLAIVANIGKYRHLYPVVPYTDSWQEKPGHPQFRGRVFQVLYEDLRLPVIAH